MALGASTLIFLILLTLIEIGLQYTAVFQVNWIETVSDILGRLLTLALTWLLFPAIISAVMSLSLDRIANAVEARHYPNLSAVSAPPLFESITVAIKFLIVLIALNIVLLFFIFTGPVYILLYYLVNGYLISREFFELVALRRLDVGSIRKMRKRHISSLILVGSGLTFLMTVPIVNLLIPIIATTTMVHLFENWRSQGCSNLIET